MPTSSRQVGFTRHPVEWENVDYPIPFNVQGGSVGFRVDVGIDPYIETVGASHSSYRVVA